ncbi:MAG: RNA polymerase sigma-54 factor, partial [Chloroflexota bacterium]|nr:RNA polymerase sigma-54 factor [Chloroflexota bacterium]
MLKNGICLNCARNANATPSQPTSGDDLAYGSLNYNEEGGDLGFSSSQYDEDFDPVSLVAAEATMRERLMMDLRSTLSSEDFPTADYLMGSMDDKGFLVTELDIVAEQMDVPVERVEHVLRIIQRLGPPGIGARDPRECLLLQLDHVVAETGEEPPHVRVILANYFVELGEHKYSHIAHKLGITLDEVDAAREYIRNNLTPYPVMWSDEDVATWGRQSRAQYV